MPCTPLGTRVDEGLPLITADQVYSRPYVPTLAALLSGLNVSDAGIADPLAYFVLLRYSLVQHCEPIFTVAYTLPS